MYHYVPKECVFGLKPWERGEVDKALGRFGPLCGVVLMEDAWMQMHRQGRHTDHQVRGGGRRTSFLGPSPSHGPGRSEERKKNVFCTKYCGQKYPSYLSGCGVPQTTDDKLRYMYRRFGMVSAPPGTRSSHPQIAMCMPIPGHALVPPTHRVLPKWRLVLQFRFLH